MPKFTMEMLETYVPKTSKKAVTRDLLDNINTLIDDPDYGQEFKDNFITYSSILDSNNKWSMQMYLNAIQYYSLTCAGLSQVKAYVRVFPDRLKKRLDRGEMVKDIGGEASRYNGTALVCKVRDQALIPLHLVNQGVVQQSINVLVDIAMNGRSEVARVTAASNLIKELRPPEVTKNEITIGLSDDARDAQERQTNAMISIAEGQQKMLEAGHSLEDIQKLNVHFVEEDDIEEAEIDE